MQPNFDDYTQSLEQIIKAEGKQTTEQKLETFGRWAEKNYLALRAMLEHAQTLYFNGCGFSIKYLIEWLRYDGRMQLQSTNDGVPEDAYKLPNAFAPIIARMFVKKKPYLRDVIKLHKSEFDDYPIPEVDF